MQTINILYKSSLPINDKISVCIPTVREVIENEDGYYGLISLITSCPYDMMVQLDDMGIDFTTMNDYDLFLMLFGGLRSQDTHLIFGDLDLTKFQPAINQQNQKVVLLNKDDDIVIDRAIYEQITSAIRKIHHMEKNKRKPANEEAKDYLLKRERRKQKRRKKQKTTSQLEELIVAMVSTEQYKYNFDTTLDLTIYQFNECVRQIVKKVDYDNKMYGIYAGTVKITDVNKDDLNWLTHK